MESKQPSFFSRKYLFLSLTALLAVAAILFTVLVATCDRQPIAADGSPVGFAALNSRFFHAVGVRPVWDKIADAVTLISLAVAACFGFLGLCQWIRRKNILRVDREILALGGVYAILASLFFLFEVLAVNCRPVLEAGETEAAASFPSSHTLVAIVVFGTLPAILPRYLRNRALLCTVLIADGALLVLGIVARVLSGVHWLTDNIAALLYAAALIALFLSLLFADPVAPQKE